jgi:hypothetical protein
MRGGRWGARCWAMVAIAGLGGALNACGGGGTLAMADRDAGGGGAAAPADGSSTAPDGSAPPPADGSSPPPPDSSSPASCPDDIFVTSSLLGGGGPPNRTILYTLAPTTAVLSRRSSTPGVNYDALGYNHLDGFLYGVNTTLGGTPHLARISTTGEVLDRGPWVAFDGQEWTLGTVLRDGTYLLGGFGHAVFLRFTLPAGPVVSGTTTYSDLTCWAVNPLDDLVYGYRFQTPGLVRVDPATGAMVVLGPLDDVGQRVCSCAFDKAGRMLLDCGEVGPAKNPPAADELDSLWTVDVATVTATFVGTTTALGGGDMASCPFSPSP